MRDPGPIHQGRERSADAPVRVSPIAVAADSSRGHRRDTRTRASALLGELALALLHLELRCFFIGQTFRRANRRQGLCKERPLPGVHPA